MIDALCMTSPGGRILKIPDAMEGERERALSIGYPIFPLYVIGYGASNRSLWINCY